ncbi:hypothetical protein PTSG_00865 [Salpingoeca rosetta]|uniref:Uncharacterized protein n=1 Tax=Salpingoeca rosetta (strain ATCC 50818 / BSB-021) TaxID=946362 RepID=F2TXP9_SALR5|nr:uncharacterized protein PTSG_00865 [Salpingoeca rosetta]EGD76158.1 hypothetical protein PTSG_00865 [Salpingoeca rosetta]|eukprot:XP_004998333.1 hypothetical protein PTSG_00865 [Salpingoeca rosetta]
MTTVAERWQHRFLNSGKGLAACLLLALVWVLLEKAAVNHVSRPTDVDTFHARDYFNSDLTWRSKRFFELTRNLSVPLPGARARAAGRPIEQTIRDLQQLERHGKALATTSLQLQADLLAAEAHISVLKSRIALGENRDILHSMWFKYCWKPGKTRICDADSVLRPIINLQAPPVVFAVYGTLVCFLAATSAGEFVVANHMICTLS